MYSQKKILDIDYCDMLVDLFHEQYHKTFRLDWKTERSGLLTDRKQRLYLIDVDTDLHKKLSSKITDSGYLIELFVVQYEVGEGVDWHTDFEYHEKQPPYKNERKINFSVPLTNDHSGGILEVDNESVDTEIGVCTYFDVKTNHRVTRVTEGTRYTLIGWIY